VSAGYFAAIAARRSYAARKNSDNASGFLFILINTFPCAPGEFGALTTAVSASASA
jgi:hypothetical protein